MRAQPEWFRSKVTTIEKSKDLDTVKIEELVGSFQTYELIYIFLLVINL